MLTRIQIKNFKRFENIDVELGQAVILVGPNNSGKTTLLQALALWEAGLKRWNEKWGNKKSPEKRPGVTINRNDLISMPVPDTNLLWRNLHVRSLERISGKQDTKNIRIDIIVSGISSGKKWECGFEFDYANAESFYCRPLRLSEEKDPARMLIPVEASGKKLAFLPPMSGLAALEPKWEPGRINVLLGEGQTAQVLRNLCHMIYDSPKPNNWDQLKTHVQKLFGIEILPPIFNQTRGEISMAYKEQSSSVQLDLSSAGRGLQQTLLLLAYLYSNPQTVLLLDEPDAHLEVLRQRQIYQLITDVAQQQSCQVIAASHSEIVLNEAADKDIVIAFIGKPHRLNDRTGRSQLIKSLTEIGFDQYAQAEQVGWVLYLEGPSDLSILRKFALKLNHPVFSYLERPFIHYVSTNLPQRAREHFHGLKEAKKELVGLALFDRIDKPLHSNNDLNEIMWNKREIENYLSMPEILIAYARYNQKDDLFGTAESERRKTAMEESIAEITKALSDLRRPDPWSSEIKASNEFLEPLFEKYFQKIELPNLMKKSDYHILAELVPVEKIDPEVQQKLDAILAVAKKANRS